MSDDVRRRPALGYSLVLLAAACWATGGLVARWLFVGPVLTVDPMDLAAARAVSAFLLLFGYVVLFRRDALIIRARDLPFLTFFGIAGLAMLHFTYFKAISLAGVATAILLEYLAPVIVLVVSVLFMGERSRWNLPAGVGLAVAGCALVVGVIGGDGLTVGTSGIAWGLAAAGFFALYMLLGKAVSDRFSSWTLLTYGLGAASLFWLAVIGGPSRVLDILMEPAGLAAVAYMAVFSTILPFGMFLAALSHIGATGASVTATIEPVIAGVGAYLLFGETLTSLQILGAVLVLIAIAVVQVPTRREAGLPPAG